MELLLCRRLSSQKWKAFKETVESLQPESRWSVRIDDNNVVFVRTLLREVIFILPFEEIQSPNGLAMYTTLDTVKYCSKDERTERSIREEINILIDELVNIDEFA